MTFAEALESYLSHMQARALSALSVRTAKSAVRSLASVAWPPTYPDLVRWQSARQQTGVSATTLHHNTKQVRLFLAWCHEMDILSSNPAARLPVPRRPRHLPETLSASELQAVLSLVPRYHRDYEADKLTARDVALVRLFTFTGIRRAEACSLDVGDVSLGTRTLRIRAGKGDKDRNIPIPDALDLAPLVRGRASTAPLFVGAYNRRRLEPRAVNAIFERKLVPLVGRRVTPHMLRHSYATLLARKGVHVRQIQELLGHSSLATTQVYLSVTADDLRGAVAVLNDL